MPRTRDAEATPVRTLVVGAGALGVLIAARLGAAGASVSLATRDPESAARLRASGLRVSGVAGELSIEAGDVTTTTERAARPERFALIVLATKAHDAIEVAPRLVDLLEPGGTLLPIQNGGVSEMLADQLGPDRVLGGLSNLGATAAALGVTEQRNLGHLLVGELGKLAGGESLRAERVRSWLGRGVEVRVTTNLRGAVWSKLMLNCSVTTLGAIAARTMRDYIAWPEGRALFDRVYDEALSVALASGARPEPMIVDPIPPGWHGRSIPSDAHDDWLKLVLHGYGDVKPSMLHDFEQGRRTEIDFINGYVVNVGRRCGVPTPACLAVVALVDSITRREIAPGRALLNRALEASLA